MLLNYSMVLINHLNMEFKILLNFYYDDLMIIFIYNVK